jgi:hypothetical protein
MHTSPVHLCTSKRLEYNRSGNKQFSFHEFVFILLLCVRESGVSLTATENLGFKIFYRLVASFFLFAIAITLVELVFIVSGFPEIHLFINPSTTLLTSGMLACFYTFHLTKKEVEEESNKQLRVT